MNNKRTGKFYRKNEADVMEQLGLTPTKGSGAGWLEKEDGYNDTILCQLKSTDAESITIKQHDLHTLLHNAIVSHKLPVFAIQFLNTGEVWLMAKPEDLLHVAKGLSVNKEERLPGIPESVIRSRDSVFPPELDKGFAQYLQMSDEERKQFEAETARRSVQSSPRDREMFYKQQKGWMNKNAE